MALKYLMGYPLNEPITLVSTLEELVRKNETLISFDENLTVDQHIDYRLKQNALKLTELQLKQQKSKSLPTLSAAVSSNYNGNSDKFKFFSSSQPVSYTHLDVYKRQPQFCLEHNW